MKIPSRNIKLIQSKKLETLPIEIKYKPNNEGKILK